MAESAELDVLGIGNALVDVLSHASDETVTSLGLVKGTMSLIDVTLPIRRFRGDEVRRHRDVRIG